MKIIIYFKSKYFLPPYLRKFSDHIKEEDMQIITYFID